MRSTGVRAPRPSRQWRQVSLYVMILPPALLLLVYTYLPMFGLVMAFQRFEPVRGFLFSPWVGLGNFQRLLLIPDMGQVFLNTFYIATLKIVVESVAAIVVALLLNEIRRAGFQRLVQTIIYFPYFLSWVILGGVFRDLLSLDGLVNDLLGALGMGPVAFLSTPRIFPWVLTATETWQVTGFGTIVYLAAISGISPTLYEAAAMDGAGLARRTWHVTLPGMSTTIVLLATLSLGWILNAGFEQILVLYNPLVYTTGDVIDTWVYRTGLRQAQYSLATAVGLFRSVVSFVVISVSYYLSYRFANYRIF